MASWDIGAVQLEGSAIDIGSVQEAAAVAEGQVITVEMSSLYSLHFAVVLLLLCLIYLIKKRFRDA